MAVCINQSAAIGMCPILSTRWEDFFPVVLPHVMALLAVSLCLPVLLVVPIQWELPASLLLILLALPAAAGLLVVGFLSWFGRSSLESFLTSLLFLPYCFSP